MESIIYSYGSGPILKDIFEAIATFFGSGALDSLIAFGMMLGGMWVIFSLIYGNSFTLITHWLVPILAIQTVLFLPKKSVKIVDPVSMYHATVDNVPIGLAEFAGVCSTVSHIITQNIEKIFSLPNDLHYHKSGFLFANSLLQKAKSFQITDPVMKDNMQGFVEQCVVFDVARGRKYTVHDLRHSANIWQLISENPSPVRGFMWRDHDGGGYTRKFVTCKDAVIKLNQMWKEEFSRSFEIFGLKIFGGQSEAFAKRALLQYLPLAYGEFRNVSTHAKAYVATHMNGMEAKSNLQDQYETAPMLNPVTKAHMEKIQRMSSIDEVGHGVKDHVMDDLGKAEQHIHQGHGTLSAEQNKVSQEVLQEQGRSVTGAVLGKIVESKKEFDMKNFSGEVQQK